MCRKLTKAIRPLELCCYWDQLTRQAHTVKVACDSAHRTDVVACIVTLVGSLHYGQAQGVGLSLSRHVAEASERVTMERSTPASSDAIEQMPPWEQWSGASEALLSKLELQEGIVVGIKPASADEFWRCLAQTARTDANLRIAFSVLVNQPVAVVHAGLLSHGNRKYGWALIEECLAKIPAVGEQWPLVLQLDKLLKLDQKLASSKVAKLTNNKIAEHLECLASTHAGTLARGLAFDAQQLLAAIKPKQKHR